MILRRGARRRAQSTAETVIALALFAIAAVGAWILYGPQIAQTTRAILRIDG